MIQVVFVLLLPLPAHLNGQSSQSSVSSLSSLTSSSSTPTSTSVSFGMRKLAYSTNQFGLDLMKVMDRSEAVTAFCPICISSTLSMMLAGAHGSTSTSLRHALYLWAMNGHEINTAFYDLMSHIGVNAPRGRRSIFDGTDPGDMTRKVGNKTEPFNDLTVLTNMYVQRDFPINYNYHMTLQRYYRTVIHPVDFHYNGQETRQHINAIVEKSTFGKIKDLLPDRTSLTTQLLLLSALYFKGTLDVNMIQVGQVPPVNFLRRTGLQSAISQPPVRSPPPPSSPSRQFHQPVRQHPMSSPFSLYNPFFPTLFRGPHRYPFNQGKPSLSGQSVASSSSKPETLPSHMNTLNSPSPPSHQAQLQHQHQSLTSGLTPQRQPVTTTATTATTSSTVTSSLPMSTLSAGSTMSTMSTPMPFSPTSFVSEATPGTSSPIIFGDDLIFVEGRNARLRYKFDRYLNSTTVEMPFKGGQVTLLLMMPSDINGLDMLLTRLSAQVLTDVLNSLEVKKLNIRMPRLKVDRSSGNLTYALSNLGLGDLFKAGFSQLFDISDYKWLSVSDILHKTYLDIRETTIGTLPDPVGTTPLPQPAPQSFTGKIREQQVVSSTASPAISTGSEAINVNFDKPFLYFIVDNVSGLLLVMGKVGREPASYRLPI